MKIFFVKFLISFFCMQKLLWLFFGFFGSFCPFFQGKQEGGPGGGGLPLPPSPTYANWTFVNFIYYLNNCASRRRLSKTHCLYVYKI
jgi:hypothetical protein